MSNKGNKKKYHVLWLGCGFSKDFGLPILKDFLRHTELLYSYEGILPPKKRRTLDGDEIDVPLAYPDRKKQPTDDEDKRALDEVENFRNSLSLPKDEIDNLEAIFSEALRSGAEQSVIDSIMRVVVRTFDVALHYRLRDPDAWSRIRSTEIKFWGRYPVLEQKQRRESYEKFLNLISIPNDEIAIITPNWDGALWEVWVDAWRREKPICSLKKIGKKPCETIPMPGFDYWKERVSLLEAINRGFQLPTNHKDILYLPLHGASNLIACERFAKEQKYHSAKCMVKCLLKCQGPKEKVFFVGGKVHSYKYRENYYEENRKGDKIDINGWRKRSQDEKDNWYRMVCTINEQEPMMPILSPPTEKQTVRNHNVLKFIWDKAGEVLQNAISIHFIGVSFPPSDVEVRKFIIEKHPIDRNCRITVTCPEAYKNLKEKWNGYSVLKELNCHFDIRDTRSTLQHFLSDPPWPFNK